MTDPDNGPSAPVLPSLAELQHWTYVMGRAQQMMLEFAAEQWREGVAHAPAGLAKAQAGWPFGDPAALAAEQGRLWTEGMDLWTRAMSLGDPDRPAAKPDRRFAAPQWEQPVFDMIRQSYLLVSDHMLEAVEKLQGVDARTREKLRFSTRAFIDAMSPSNFAATNPEVIERAIETRGESLLKGLEHMLRDLSRGQLSHTDDEAFELGRNVAATPGKVIHETPLFQLIHYMPTTAEVEEVPVLIFPPWINRFYILDLNPKKSFIRWAVEQGLSLFVVSWKSADESMADLTMADYVKAEAEAIDVVREALGVEAVHAIGYCVAGTTLAATLAWLEARDEADKVASATFLTAQVDFADAGDLSLFVGDEQLQLIQQLSAETGYLDGRYMAATFNLLRGRDLIWNYVTANYLKGEDYPPFDLLYWNGDTTNLSARWHQEYLTLLYRDNKLVQPGAIEVEGVPINLSKVTVPAYVQAGREDHIAPARSVWKIHHHFQGPLRFVLAGSGHIAGVVNPPEANKYQYWTNEGEAESLDAFIAGATEHKGSWWPDWRAWIARMSDGSVKAKGARIPGKGKLKAIEGAPGRYVKTR